MGWGTGFGIGWGSGTGAPIDTGGDGGGPPDDTETPLDLRAQAQRRIILQYRESTKLLALIDAFISPLQEIENAAITIPSLDDIDTAGGVNLDVIGEIVGQSRTLPNADVVDDSEYRILIKARIARNQSHSTMPEMIDALDLIFSAPILLWDWGEMNIGYAIGREITPDEISVLVSDILPRPMGVVVYPREWYDPADYFAMAEDTGAAAGGFADDSGGWPGTGGGRLAEEF